MDIYCKECKQLFTPKTGYDEICSDSCRKNRMIRANKSRTKSHEVKCRWCACIFRARGPKKYCSKECIRLSTNASHREYFKSWIQPAKVAKDEIYNNMTDVEKDIELEKLRKQIMES